MYIWLGLERGSGRANRTYFIHLPMKMEPIASSETSAIRTQTTGNYPKRNKLHLEHGESLKTRICWLVFGTSSSQDSWNFRLQSSGLWHRLILYIQYGLVLRRFVLRRFTFMTPVQSDRALPTCGASLSPIKHPFFTQCAYISFPLCMCFCFLYFSAVLLGLLWFFHPRRPSKWQKRRKNQNIWRHILYWCLLNHSLGLLQQNKKWLDWYFFQLSV